MLRTRMTARPGKEPRPFSHLPSRRIWKADGRDVCFRLLSPVSSEGHPSFQSGANGATTSNEWINTINTKQRLTRAETQLQHQMPDGRLAIIVEFPGGTELDFWTVGRPPFTPEEIAQRESESRGYRLRLEAESSRPGACTCKVTPADDLTPGELLRLAEYQRAYPAGPPCLPPEEDPATGDPEMKGDDRK